MASTSIPTNPNDDGHALQFWEPRRALTLDAARRHSIFVRRARWVLIGFAVLLVGMLGWYFIQSPPGITQTDNPEESVKMVNPIYKGRTGEGLPYRILADDAVRFLNKPDEVRLSNPILNFLREEGAEESIVVAASGLYNSEMQVLELRADVNLDTDNGYICDTSHARVFVDEKRIEGDEKITCTGDFGTVNGNAYEINDNYREFVFKNGMSGRINPGSADDVFAPQETTGDQQ